jgi:formylglycine-generating enzyme required for sulfatase activity
MKTLKYILFASLFAIGLVSCEKPGEPTPAEQPNIEPPQKTQDEIEVLWPDSIITAEAGEFILVSRPQNGYTMGDNNLQYAPEQLVQLNKSFYMCTTEVTQAQWKAIMGTNPSDNEFIKEGANTDNCPVNNISLKEAQNFVKALNTATGRKFAIPTQQQWEWAAIGGKLSNDYTYSGSNTSAEVAWSAIDYSDQSLSEVAKLKANELGLYDMSGNVAEWTSSTNIIRGGHYETINIEELNVRHRGTSSEANYAIGLRLIIEEPLETELKPEVEPEEDPELEPEANPETENQK